MDYEQAFSDFLDSREFDEAERALFEITRQAFKAGWLAAKDSAPPENKILELKSKGQK